MIHFSRMHPTLRVTQATEAGIADPVWSMEEIVNLLCLVFNQDANSIKDTTLHSSISRRRRS
jgi:hypothetical protein